MKKFLPFLIAAALLFGALGLGFGVIIATQLDSDNGCESGRPPIEDSLYPKITNEMPDEFRYVLTSEIRELDVEKPTFELIRHDNKTGEEEVLYEKQGYIDLASFLSDMGNYRAYYLSNTQDQNGLVVLISRDEIVKEYQVSNFDYKKGGGVAIDENSKVIAFADATSITLFDLETSNQKAKYSFPSTDRAYYILGINQATGTVYGKYEYLSTEVMSVFDYEGTYPFEARIDNGKLIEVAPKPYDFDNFEYTLGSDDFSHVERRYRYDEDSVFMMDLSDMPDNKIIMKMYTKGNLEKINYFDMSENFNLGQMILEPKE